MSLCLTAPVRWSSSSNASWIGSRQNPPALSLCSIIEVTNLRNSESWLWHHMSIKSLLLRTLCWLDLAMNKVLTKLCNSNYASLLRIWLRLVPHKHPQTHIITDQREISTNCTADLIPPQGHIAHQHRSKLTELDIVIALKNTICSFFHRGIFTQHSKTHDTFSQWSTNVMPDADALQTSPISAPAPGQAAASSCEPLNVPPSGIVMLQVALKIPRSKDTQIL